jgi:guanylate kinase
MSSDEPLLLIVSSPSGAGKTTLASRLLAQVSGLSFSVSHTTRRPRASEVDGREYHFVDRAKFEGLIREDAFLEWAEVHDNLYGTSRAEVERAGNARGILFDVDHQGARQIKSVRPDAVAVFILPPSMTVLKQRLHGRASEDTATVERRFRVARSEIAHYGLFDYVLMNDDLERATTQLVSIVLAEECRRGRAARLAEQLLAETHGFGGTVPPHAKE